MKRLALLLLCLAASALAQAQAPAPAGDTWSNMPQASDDRYSNPKSKLYAGPNGWHNFGEVRAVVANPAKTRYDVKAGFNTTAGLLVLADASSLRTLSLDFGDPAPPPGTYEAAAKAGLAQKKVRVSMSDVSGGKIREWTSADKAGSVTVSKVNGYLYVKMRDVQLKPNGTHNTGDMKQPMTLGFEGALAP